LFSEFANVDYTGSSGAVSVADNTDFVVSGTAKKITFSDALNEYVTVSFDEVDLSDYEEVVLYIYSSPLLTDADLFSITIGGTAYSFTAQNDRGQYQQLVWDCSTWGAVSSFVITSLVSDLVLFVNYIGYRKVEYSDLNYDTLTALQDAISLNYDVTTTLDTQAKAGDETIDLTDNTDIFDSTMLLITEGETTEYCQLVSRDGLLKTDIVNDFTTAAVVTAECLTKVETYDDVNIDPVCGIVITGWQPRKEDFWQMQVNATKLKRYLGKLTINIYIECSSKEKVLQLASEYEENYGDGFSFLLDGDRVEIYSTDTFFVDDEIGDKTRVVYEYTFQPQPVTIDSRIAITDITFDLESVT
jgi:hypothetical protein